MNRLVQLARTVPRPVEFLETGTGNICSTSCYRCRTYTGCKSDRTHRDRSLPSKYEIVPYHPFRCSRVVLLGHYAPPVRFAATPRARPKPDHRDAGVHSLHSDVRSLTYRGRVRAADDLVLGLVDEPVADLQFRRGEPLVFVCRPLRECNHVFSSTYRIRRINEQGTTCRRGGVYVRTVSRTVLLVLLVILATTLPVDAGTIGYLVSYALSASSPAMLLVSGLALLGVAGLVRKWRS